MALGAVAVFVVGAVAVLVGWNMRIESRVRRHLADDELWGDLGDKYGSRNRAELADGAYSVALLLDPDDGEWSGHEPTGMGVLSTLRRLRVQDDQFVGGLGDAAAAQGQHLLAAALFQFAGELDLSSSEWPEKAALHQLIDPFAAQLAENPNDDEAWGDLGDALSDGGAGLLGESAYAVALLLDPLDEEWRGHGPSMAWADSVVRVMGMTDDQWVGALAGEAARGRHLHASRSLYRLALELNPGHEPWRIAGALPESVLDVAAGARSNLNDDQAWVELGHAFGAVGQWDVQGSAYAVATLLNPNDTETWKRQPDVTDAPAVIAHIGVTDDEWVGDLGDAAAALGWDGVSRALYLLALRLDPGDTEWRGNTSLMTK